MPKLVIGTRGSPLALAQAREFQAALIAASPALDAAAVEIAVIKTGADKVPERPIAELGGKGLFVKEIEDALLAERIDVAVHSVKDLPGMLPDGLELACVLAREDPRDAFISRTAAGIDELAPGAAVGTSSPRRRAQILARRPDLVIRPLRGNVATRLRKLNEGVAAALILAMAGLNRLGLSAEATAAIPPDVMLPAVGQGAIGAECRDGDSRTRDLLAAVSHADSETRIRAERAFLAALGGSCRTPIGGFAEITNNRLVLKGLVASLDGARTFETERSGAPSEAAAMGKDAGDELRARAGPDMFAA